MKQSQIVHVGGIPLVYSCGDSFQLPAVLQGVFYDQFLGDMTKYDGMGQVVFRQFLEPDDANEEDSTMMYTSEVIHQNDGTFKDVLTNMHAGEMTSEDAEFIIN